MVCYHGAIVGLRCTVCVPRTLLVYVTNFRQQACCQRRVRSPNAFPRYPKLSHESMYLRQSRFVASNERSCSVSDCAVCASAVYSLHDVVFSHVSWQASSIPRSCGTRHEKLLSALPVLHAPCSFAWLQSRAVSLENSSRCARFQ